MTKLPRSPIITTTVSSSFRRPAPPSASNNRNGPPPPVHNPIAPTHRRTGSDPTKETLTRINTSLAADPLLASLTPPSVRSNALDPEHALAPPDRDAALLAAEALASVTGWLEETQQWGLDRTPPPAPADGIFERDVDPVQNEWVSVNHIVQRSLDIWAGLDALELEELQAHVRRYVRGGGGFDVNAGSALVTATALELLPLTNRLRRRLQLWEAWIRGAECVGRLPPILDGAGISKDMRPEEEEEFEMQAMATGEAIDAVLAAVHTPKKMGSRPPSPPSTTASTPESVVRGRRDDAGSPAPRLLPSPVFTSDKEDSLNEVDVLEGLGIRSLSSSRATTPEREDAGALLGLGIIGGMAEPAAESEWSDDSSAELAHAASFEEFVAGSNAVTPVDEPNADSADRAHARAPARRRGASTARATELPSIIESSPRPAKDGKWPLLGAKARPARIGPPRFRRQRWTDEPSPTKSKPRHRAMASVFGRDPITPASELTTPDDSPPAAHFPRDPLTPPDLSSTSRDTTPEKRPPRELTLPKRAPRTPRRGPITLDDRISDILASLPRPVKLTSGNLALHNTRPPPFPITSDTSTPAPPPPRRAPASDIRCYHLHRNDGAAPLKLYVRLVGENRLVCRVGGGWSDLEEYLREWAVHHGSKMRNVSESRLALAGRLRPSASSASLGRAVSPSPAEPARPLSALARRHRQSFGEEPATLGLAGPRGARKELGEERQRWIEGMLGQVRMQSGVEQGEEAAADDDDETDRAEAIRGRGRSWSNVSAGVRTGSRAGARRSLGGT